MAKVVCSSERKYQVADTMTIFWIIQSIRQKQRARYRDIILNIYKTARYFVTVKTSVESTARSLYTNSNPLFKLPTVYQP